MEEEQEGKRRRKARGGGRDKRGDGEERGWRRDGCRAKNLTTAEKTVKSAACWHPFENNFQITIPLPPYPILLTNIVEQFPSRHVLHDHEYVGGCGDDLVQLDDVWVAKQLQNLDLPTDLLNHIQTTGRRAISSVYMYHRYE